MCHRGVIWNSSWSCIIGLSFESIAIRALHHSLSVFRNAYKSGNNTSYSLFNVISLEFFLFRHVLHLPSSNPWWTAFGCIGMWHAQGRQAFEVSLLTKVVHDDLHLYLLCILIWHVFCALHIITKEFSQTICILITIYVVCIITYMQCLHIFYLFCHVLNHLYSNKCLCCM